MVVCAFAKSKLASLEAATTPNHDVKREIDQYSAIRTSRSVNKIYELRNLSEHCDFDEREREREREIGMTHPSKRSKKRRTVSSRIEDKSFKQDHEVDKGTGIPGF